MHTPVYVHFYRPNGLFGWLICWVLGTTYCHVSVQDGPCLADVSVFNRAAYYPSLQHIAWRRPDRTVPVDALDVLPPRLPNRRMKLWANLAWALLWPWRPAPFNCVTMAVAWLRDRGAKVDVAAGATPDDLLESLLA
jgi:hypothetical protein